MTNFEKIKSMSVNELARLMNSVSSCVVCPICGFCEDIRLKSNRFIYCNTVWKKWLKSETKKDD